MGVSGSSDGSPSAVLELVVPSDCRGELGAPFFFSKKNRVSNSVFFEYELCAWIWCWFLDLEWWHCCVYGVILLMAELKLVYLS